MATHSVTVRVPATSANMGPGFDCLGIALDWTSEITLEASDQPVRAPEDPITRMVISAALSLYTRVGVAPPAGLSARYVGDVPVGRGLGVSAAARVAGLLAADALIEGGEPHSADAILALATQLERHADNAAPALLGGLQVVVADDDGIVHIGITPPADLRVALLVPEFSMPTEESRLKLPERVTLNQAVHNIGRAALLVAALSQQRYDLLTTAMEDVLHQPARATIFTAMYPIFQAARDAGAVGVYLSGGGPTIAALVSATLAEDVAGAMREAAASHGVQSTTRVCGFQTAGAEIIART